MKNLSLKLAITVVGAMLFFTSCKKDGCTDPLASNYKVTATEDDGSCEYGEVTATAPSGFTPSFAGSFGAFVSIKSLTTTNTGGITFDASIGTAVAMFSEDGGANFQDAGEVKVNTKVLTKQDNNSYVFTPSASSPTGIDFTDDVSWVVAGGTWPAVTAASSVGFPTVDDINSGDVNTGSDYVLSCPEVADADSVYFGLYGSENAKFYIVAGGTSSYTFSAADMVGLGSGDGFVQIVGINYDPQSIDGKDYWIINETARTKMVKFN
ncbi:hypothetical protein [Crocinitomix catalasitica]|uniref:hypothetical protein n=1 Tax=Crocinitomix catalasitica TaxID=184607 RepID=UPI000480B078|nr:hypothetical protein [Crocinitomix catalasitica]